MLSHTLTQADSLLDLVLSMSSRGGALEYNQDGTIYLYSSGIQQRDEAVIVRIFEHLSNYPDTKYKVRIYFSKLLHTQCEEQYIGYSGESFQGETPPILQTLAKNALSFNSTFILNAIAEVLSKTNRYIDFELFANEALLIVSQQDCDSVDVVDVAFGFTKIFKFIHERCQNPAVIKSMLPTLIGKCVSIGLTFVITDFKLDSDIIKAAIRDNDNPEHSYLHTALARVNYYPAPYKDDGVELLLGWINPDEMITHNANGENLLELCNNKEYYELFLLILKNKSESLVSDLKAAMIAACKIGNLEKILFLLKCDMTLLETLQEKIKSYQNNNSDFYRFCYFYVHGKTLSIFPELMKQRGYTCGFYAARSAYSFLQMLYPKQFCSEIIHTRSGDIKPKATKSLLKMAKAKKNITQIGELFSSDAISEVIKLTGCQSTVFEIETKDHFLQIIHAAIKHNYPVLLPFSAEEGYGNRIAKGESAHWAVIIGYSEDKLLTAQYNKFIEDTIESLYFAFDQIEEKYPPRLFRKENKNWMKIGNPPETTEKNELIISANLSQFRRRLVVVLPPHHNVEEWRASVITGVKCHRNV